MTEPPVFEPQTADVIIRDIHQLAEEFGFRRLRIDRSGFGGTDERPACWVEVGYASKQVIVRTSDPGLEVLLNLERQSPADLDEVAQVLLSLLDRVGLASDSQLEVKP